MALHYKKPEEGPLAARLLTMLGYVQTQDLLLPSGTHFYRFVVDPRHHPRGDGIVYLSCVPDAQRDLMDAIHEALHVGTEQEHPAVGAMRRKMDEDPEYAFHYGTLLESLEDLEAIFQALMPGWTPRRSTRTSRGSPTARTGCRPFSKRTFSRAECWGRP